MGAAANVVLRLSQTIEDFKNHILSFDNFYTSIPLLVYLKQQGIHSVGTIRGNHIPNNKLPSDAELKKENRGFSAEVVAEINDVKVSVSVWKDNKPVRLASTYVGTIPIDGDSSVKTVSRYLRSEKRYVEIPCPPVIMEYNKHMGGVDLMDGLIGRYRIRTKTNKYTTRTFFHLLDVTLVNAYLLYKRINKPDVHEKEFQLPSFRSQIAQILTSFCVPGIARPIGRPRKLPIPKSSKKTYLPSDEVRYDNIGHFPDYLARGDKKTCKLESCKSETQVVCIKCNIHLCLTSNKNCFFYFHHREI